jgi:lysylphosphatidylglycerol synthetase-like protein (DUF2156 family)
VKWFLILLVACVAVTALKFAIIALILALIITLLWGAYAHPGELFGTLAFFLAANLLMTHTVACLTLVGFIGFWLIVRRPDATPTQEQAEQKLLANRASDETDGAG